MQSIKNGLLILVVLLLVTPAVAAAGRLPEPEELDNVIAKITSKQSKNIRTFESKVREYFFDTEKKDAIVSLVKEFPPGEAVAILVLTELSKKSSQDVAAMKKAGKSWPEIAEQCGVKLKAVIKEIKAFRSGAG